MIFPCQFLTKARVKYEKNDEDANLIDALQEASPKYYNSIKDNNITNYFNWPFIEETYGDSRTKASSVAHFDVHGVNSSFD